MFPWLHGLKANNASPLRRFRCKENLAEGTSFVPFSQSLGAFLFVTQESSVSDSPIGQRRDQRSDLFTPKFLQINLLIRYYFYQSLEKLIIGTPVSLVSIKQQSSDRELVPN